MNVANNLLSFRENWCIVRSITIPTLYWFFTFIIRNIVAVIIRRFFIPRAIRVLRWVTFISLKILIRKITCIIVPEIVIRCKNLLFMFKIIRPLNLPIWNVFPFSVLLIRKNFLLHSLFKGFRIMGESTDLGNTFWQENFGKNKKMYLGRGFNKPSTEVLISRPSFYQALDRGFFQPSVEVFINPRSRYWNLDRGLINTSTEVWTSVEVHSSTEFHTSVEVSILKKL